MGATCRSCSAPITWARTEHGRKMPVDVDPVELAELEGTAGLFVLRETDDPAGPLVVASTPAQNPGDRHYRSHFATCPNADQHRRRP